MSYRPEWISGPLFLGTVLVLLIVPPFALIAFGVLLVAALAALAALVAAIAATPYRLFRSGRSRWAQHVADRQNAEPIGRGLTPVPSKEM